MKEYMLMQIQRRLKFFVAILAFAGMASGAGAKLLPIHNETPWYDTDGKEIKCQGGCISKFGDTYYWYGIDTDPTPAPLYRAVRCYTSKDLSRWKFEREVFTKHVPNRVDVVYNAKTKKYVMFTKEMDPGKDEQGKPIENGGTGIAISDTPTGDFIWKGRAYLPDSAGGGDQSVFVDDDGKAYISYAVWITRREHNKLMMCAELTDDYQNVAQVTYKFPFQEGKLEAPAIFKRNGIYYWMTSGVRWWYSSTTYFSSANSMKGPWTPWKVLSSKNPKFKRDVEYDTCNSQHDFVVNVKGTEGTFYMYCGDRYSQYTKWGVGRVVWLPLQFDGDTPYLDWHRSWYIDAERGVWSASQGDDK